MSEIEATQQQTRKGPGLITIIVWIAVAGLLIFLATGLAIAFATQPDSGAAPDFTLKTFDGETYRISDLQGQVIVINFWASWCAPCAEEAPALERAWREYQDQGVIFLGVAYIDAEDKSLAFIEKYGVTYPNGPDIGSHISDDYRIRGVPETFIVGPNGDIVFFAQAPLTYAQLSREIEQALADSQ